MSSWLTIHFSGTTLLHALCEDNYFQEICLPDSGLIFPVLPATYPAHLTILIAVVHSYNIFHWSFLFTDFFCNFILDKLLVFIYFHSRRPHFTIIHINGEIHFVSTMKDWSCD
jgi:hypothetical protein